jgi:N-acetylneuraminate synthase
MNPTALSELIHGSKILFKERGGAKHAVPEEQATIAFAFASVVAIKDIKKGEPLSEQNIWVRRPGEGDFSAADYDSLIGKIAFADIKKGEQISKTHLEK